MVSVAPNSLQKGSEKQKPRTMTAAPVKSALKNPVAAMREASSTSRAPSFLEI